MSQFDRTIWQKYKNPGEKFSEADIIDMQMTDDETTRLTTKFTLRIKAAEEDWKRSNPNRPIEEAPWGKFVRSALMSCVGCEVFTVAFMSTIGD